MSGKSKKSAKDAARAKRKSMGRSTEKASERATRKESQFVLRVDTALRDAFVDACRSRDTSASRELRRCMREYLVASGD